MLYRCQEFTFLKTKMMKDVIPAKMSRPLAKSTLPAFLRISWSICLSLTVNVLIMEYFIAKIENSTEAKINKNEA